MQSYIVRIIKGHIVLAILLLITACAARSESPPADYDYEPPEYVSQVEPSVEPEPKPEPPTPPELQPVDEQLLSAAVEDEPEQEPELAPTPEQQTPSVGGPQPPYVGGGSATHPIPTAPSAQSIFNDFRNLVVQEPPESGAFHITIFDVMARFHLFAEPAGEFLAGINVNRLTTVQGDFDGAWLSHFDIPHGTIRLWSFGFEYELLFDPETNIAHFIGGDAQGHFYHMPPGFYDALYARVMEFEQHRAW